MAGGAALPRRRRLVHVNGIVILRKGDWGREDSGPVLETMLHSMKDAVARVVPVEWNGPEDGSLAGNLDCSDGIEISVHMETQGLHVDVCELNDPDHPGRGGMIGTVVDERMSVDRFMNVDAARAHALMIGIVDDWIAELASSVRSDSVQDEFQRQMEAADQAAAMFNCLVASTGLKEDGYLLRIGNPTPHSAAWVSAEDRPSGQWTLDAESVKACLKDLERFTILTLEARSPPILRIFGKTWMPDVEERPCAITIMRAMESADLRHVVQVVPE